METVLLSSLNRFDKAKMQKVPIFSTERLFYDLYCLLPGQFQKVHSHVKEDKIYLVLEGEATFEIGGKNGTLGNGEAVIARAGISHGVRNSTDQQVILLVTMAPRPS
jgi:quercetin dioxygenase-like cupin family protein